MSKKKNSKKTKQTRNTRKLRITLDIILILIGFVFLGFGINDLIGKINSNKVSDSERFHMSYNYVPAKKSKYKYVDISMASKLLKSDDAVILLGNPTDPWTQVLVKPLNDIIKGKVIYYVETKTLDVDNKNVKKFLENAKLKSIETPTLITVDKGKTTILTKKDIYGDYKGVPLEYFNEDNINKLKELVND